MVFNLESGFLSAALAQLGIQYRRVDPKFDGKLTLGSSTLTFMVIKQGPDEGKLTIGQRVNGTFVPHPDIQPVDYANLITPGESLADANRRVFLQKRNYEC